MQNRDGCHFRHSIQYRFLQRRYKSRIPQSMHRRVESSYPRQHQMTGIKDARILTARMGPDSLAPGNRVHLPRGIENLDLRVSEYSHPGSDQKQYAGYFFIANGGLTSSAQNVRLLSFDLKSDYAYYLKVQFTATHIKGADELAQIAGSILDDILPDIMQVIPDWTDVIRGDYPADNPRRKKNTPELSGK